jgi:hypothetical protein
MAGPENIETEGFTDEENELNRNINNKYILASGVKSYM